MTLLVLRLEDSRTGQVEDRILGDWYACMREGVLLGSAEDCTVRLVAPGIAGHHARYTARGHHRFLDVLDEDAEVLYLEKPHRRGDYLRADYRPFTIGPYTLRFGEQSSEEE